MPGHVRDGPNTHLPQKLQDVYRGPWGGKRHRKSTISEEKILLLKVKVDYACTAHGNAKTEKRANQLLKVLDPERVKPHVSHR